jgi:capsid protein
MPHAHDDTDELLARAVEARAIHEEYKARCDAAAKDCRDRMQRLTIEMWLLRQYCRSARNYLQDVNPDPAPPADRLRRGHSQK